MKWLEQAKCKNENRPTSKFFEEFEKAGISVKTEMVKFCDNCKVINECYDHALAEDETGLWGGTYFQRGKPSNPMRARYLENQRDGRSMEKATADLDARKKTIGST